MTIRSLLLLCFFIAPVILFSQTEKILRYHTDIEVNFDRSIDVIESIQVYAAGDRIKRGITRNLLNTRSFNGKTMRVKYHIQEVLKNGIPEPYLSKSGNGETILYIGEEDVILSPGVYSYTIKYNVPNQIAFFEFYDEIYWNAIGQDVQFVIDSASCIVRLPEGVDMTQEYAYTGKYGSQEQDYSMVLKGTAFEYKTTRSLQPGEGLSVAVGFEKGHLKPPSIFQKFGTLILILLGCLFLLPYYIQTWWKFGQDPATPASYPIWESPDGLSAASVNYIQKGRYQTASFTGSIIHLAVKGYLKIEEVADKGIIFKSKHFDLLRLKDGDESLPLEEQKLMESLFISGDKVSIDGKYESGIRKTYEDHSASLSFQHSDFINQGNNTRLLWVPILVTLIVGAISAVTLASSPYAEWINLTALLIFAPIAILGFILYVFLIRKPSIDKLDLRSRIAGFKMYLGLAEKDRLSLLNPPERTPEHFEDALPYAFALGIAHKWSEQFASILEAAQYRPEWHNSTNPVYFSHHFSNDFSRNLSGSVTQPSSSGGGSTGGGFSGGGGGGGGVGGW